MRLGWYGQRANGNATSGPPQHIDASVLSALLSLCVTAHTTNKSTSTSARDPTLTRESRCTRPPRAPSLHAARRRTHTRRVTKKMREHTPSPLSHSPRRRMHVRSRTRVSVSASPVRSLGRSCLAAWDPLHLAATLDKSILQRAYSTVLAAAVRHRHLPSCSASYAAATSKAPPLLASLLTRTRYLPSRAVTGRSERQPCRHLLSSRRRQLGPPHAGSATVRAHVLFHAIAPPRDPNRILAGRRRRSCRHAFVAGSSSQLGEPAGSAHVHLAVGNVLVAAPVSVHLRGRRQPV